MTDYKKIIEPVEGKPDWSPFYAEALKGNITAITEGAPQPGYYRWHYKGEAFWRGAAIFNSGNGLQFAVKESADSQLRLVSDPNERGRFWTWCAKGAVSKTLFYEFNDTGVWRDHGAPAAAGHNLPADPFEALKVEIKDKLANASALLEKAEEGCADDKEAADRATNLADELAAQIKRADAMHKEEKAVYLAGVTAIDTKFRFRSKIVEPVVRQLREFAKTWQIAETLRLQAAADAERKRLEAEQEKQHKELAEQFPGVPLEAPEPVIVAPVKRAQVGGATKAKTGLKKEFNPMRVDTALAFEHYKDHPDIVAAIGAALDELASKIAKRDKETAFVWGYKIVNELGQTLSDGINQPKKDAA